MHAVQSCNTLPYGPSLLTSSHTCLCVNTGHHDRSATVHVAMLEWQMRVCSPRHGVWHHLEGTYDSLHAGWKWPCSHCRRLLPGLSSDVALLARQACCQRTVLVLWCACCVLAQQRPVWQLKPGMMQHAVLRTWHRDHAALGIRGTNAAAVLGAQR